MISETNQTPTPSANRAATVCLRLVAAASLFLAAPPPGAFARPDPPLSTPDASDEPLRTAREATERKDFGKAAEVLRVALRDDPDNKEMLSLRARVLAWSRHFNESIATYRKLLARYPDDAFDRVGYARALAWSGRSHAAIPEFRRAIAQDPDNLESKIGYARALSWYGDLAGASDEYLRILAKDPENGDAWLGLATVARWRDAPTASDAFAKRAASRGADAEGIQEERKAARQALRTAAGTGWTRTRERQITSDSTAFKLETAGQFLEGRATLEHTLGIAVRASRLHHWEKNPGLPTDTTLNYDLTSTGFRGDLSYLRRYPLQIAAGIAYQRFDARNPTVLFPLRGDDDFFGFNARVWGYAGRLTPSAGIHREFIAIKDTDTTTGVRSLVPGGVTSTDLGLRWDWNGRSSMSGALSKSTYTDDNDRTSVGGVVAYRLNTAQPRLILDYGLTWSDFSKPSASYFTPLESVRHAAGLGLTGYSDKASLDYGARYEFSFMQSANFEDITTNAWSAYVNGSVLDGVPLGLEAYYSVDNHSYRTWALTVSGSVGW
ncbi:MAG TPA: tetratricopeptide repeat protein [Candidatus Limnocylindrales bacterium]|nr:tetratricopeptide repeat protein [Candidatus Limnocylindrales bacterium]